MNTSNIQKRNPETKQYDDYAIDKEWYCPLFCDDMDEIINCSECGAQMKYGICYTSRLIHNNIGFGYPVCGKCYDKECNLLDLYNK